MSLTNVILIRPQEHDYEYVQWHEDIYLSYLLSTLEQKGYRCRTFDFALKPLLTEDDHQIAIDQMASLGASLFVFVFDKHPTNSPYYGSKLIYRCRNHPKLSDAHFTVYGNTQVGTRRMLQELPVDSVVIGEEVDCLELVNAVVTDSSLDKVPGIAFQNNFGSYRENSPLPRVALDALPSPKRYFFDLPDNEKTRRGYVGAILASRGCYAKCTFCYIRTKERVYGDYRWIGRTPQKVVDEINQLYCEHGVREFTFCDPQFFGPGKSGHHWGREIAQGIIDRGLTDISFTLYARANDITDQNISLLKKAGLYAVFVGIESFSQSTLERYRKGVSVEQNIKAIRLLMDYDVRLRMGFISFDHHTTMDELRENLAFLKEVCSYKPHLITQPIFFQGILAPLEDTPVGDEYERIGASSTDVQYCFQEKISEHQKRLTRYGPITTFSDSRVAYVSEAARILASEILQRTTMLENHTSKMLYGGKSSGYLMGNRVKLPETMEWFDNLTLFVVTFFDELFEMVEAEDTPQPELLDRMATFIVNECTQYDLRHLKFALSTSIPVRDVVFD